MFKLVISDDEGKTTVVPLVRDEITIGRKEGNTIRLTERNVSRRHARLRKANGSFVVEDLGSYNGVKLNGKRIQTEAKVTAGDQVTIGDYLLALQAEAVASAPPPAPSGSTPAGPPARLVMLTPPAPGAEFALSKDRIRIGRAEDLDVWVNHRSISREHAEIILDAEGFKVLDLGSANGVRVNSEETTDVPLQAGDVIELGQVRFRYVPAGEDYVFDVERTIQMDAIVVPPPTSKMPMFAALGILLIALAGAAIALSGDDEPEGGGVASPIAPPIAAVPAPPGQTGDDPQAAADEAAARCRTAFGAEQLVDAIQAANQALGMVPGHAGASQCRAEAEAAQETATKFQEGQTALQQGDFGAAHFAFGEIPADNPLRQRPEVARARDGYVAHELEQGQALLATSPQDAGNHAEAVLATEGVTRAQRATANTILAAASRTGRVRPRNPRNPRPTMRTEPRTTTMMTPVMAEEPAQGNPLEAARACLRRGDNNCVIQSLEGGRARSSQALSLLIETYRTVGNTPAALRHMRTFVRRYPSDRRASRYQQFLQNHGN